jgi:hypothetical protein
VRTIIAQQRHRPVAQKLLSLAHNPSDDRASRLDGMNNAGCHPRADVDHPGIAALCRLRQLLPQRALMRAKLVI